MFQSVNPSASLDTRLQSDSAPNYVNIPISHLPARPNKELLYTELDLQEPGSAPACSSYSAVRDNTLLLCRPSKNTEP